MKNVIIALALTLMLLPGAISCKKEGKCRNAAPADVLATNASKVNIRIRNAGDRNYCAVKVTSWTDGSVKNYGPVQEGEASGYQWFEEAYRYGRIDVEANGKTYELRPIDFVGATPLASGWYTYHLTLDELNQSVSIQVTQD